MPTGMGGPPRQDWEPIVLQKRGQKASESRDPKAVNEALRSGAAVESVKKHNAGSNKGDPGPGLNARKLEEDTEGGEHEKVSTDVKVAIQKARLAAKLSQAQLAQKINEKEQVVKEYENGKAIPNQQVLGKLERVLGVKLRGKPK